MFKRMMKELDASQMVCRNAFQNIANFERKNFDILRICFESSVNRNAHFKCNQQQKYADFLLNVKIVRRKLTSICVGPRA